VYRDELAVELPAYGVDPENTLAVLRAFRDAPEHSLFHQIFEPAHLALAEFMLERAGRVFHVGVVLDTPDGLYVMHNQQGSGVVLTRPHVCPPLKYWRYLNESTGLPSVTNPGGLPP